MNADKLSSKELYYTNDHEWIDFQGSVAYVGICSFKLLGFKEIQEINFIEPSGFKKQGAVIATVMYKDYQIEAHMPVDGKLVQVNEKLLSGDHNALLLHAENNGWIALIIPSNPDERKDLLVPSYYQMKYKSINKKL